MESLTKKAVVTGAGRSIGRAIALQLAEQGVEVLISYCHNKEGAAETVKLIESMGAKATACQADFSSSDGVIAFSKKAIDTLGDIDILINNAAVVNRDDFLSISPEDLQAIFQVNTLAPFILSQAISKHMISKRTEGCIIHISSIAATRNTPAAIAYSASKAALNKITENSAIQLAEHNIRVNAVAPGVIAAGMNEKRLSENPDLHAHYQSAIPLNRTGTPDDIANMVSFLVSEKASWITGQIFDVDGGHALVW